MTLTKTITNPQALYRFLATPVVEVAALLLDSDEVVCASWRFIADEKVPNLRHTNEVIGVFVTTGARIHVSKYLDRIKQKAHYFDTDSVIFIQPDDQPGLFETGDCMVGMTSEMEPDLHIEEFVSGGPKNYA
jgi:hypothetical protein